MPRAPILRLSLVDVYDAPIGVAAGVRCRNMITGAVREFRSVPGKTLLVRGLDGGATGVYRVEVDPAGYLPSGVFVNIRGSGTTTAVIPLAVDPARVGSVVFPAFAELDSGMRRLVGSGQDVVPHPGLRGRALYDALLPIERAGLLNVTAKCRATPLGRRRSVLSGLEALREVRGDRLFAAVSPAFVDEVSRAAEAGMFEKVSGALHEPPPGATPAGSFKTRDRYGNLQVTFFAAGDTRTADVDIDDAGGLAHVFQVLSHAISGRETHPYDIHEILMRYQRIDTGYRFVVEA